MSLVAQRWAHIQQTLQNHRGGAIKILAVSKGHPAQTIRQATQAGLWAFGENYVQEALAKQALLGDLAIEWHFIGGIQSNKTQAIAQNFSWVHSVSRLEIATRLSASRSLSLPPLNVCIQVNISAESTKQGVAPHAVYALAQAINDLPQIRLRGLMAMPLPSQHVMQQSEQFKRVYALYCDLQQKGFSFDTLSMGTSHDYLVAVAEGATMVRLGTILLGERHALSAK